MKNINENNNITNRKENFIDDYAKINSSLSSYGRQRFDRVSSYEEKYGKDLSEFSEDQILEFYKSLKSNCLEFLMAYNSFYKSYTNWCVKNGFAEENNYKSITQEKLYDCLDKKSVNKKIISRDEVENICNNLVNPSDAFLVLALFEGIYGKSYSEIFSANENQLDGNIMHLGDRDLIISDKLVNYLHKACNEYNYYCYSSDTDRIKEYDAMDKSAIKRMFNANEINESNPIIQMQRCRLKLARIKDSLEMPELSSNSLQESGRINMIKELMKQDNSNDAVQTYKNHRKEIEDRYGTVVSLARYMLKYGSEFSSQDERCI